MKPEIVPPTRWGKRLIKFLLCSWWGHDYSLRKNHAVCRRCGERRSTFLRPLT